MEQREEAGAPLGLKDLIARAKSRIREVDVRDAAALLGSGALFVDVRESEELAGGRIAGALHVPRGVLEAKAAHDSPVREPALAPERPIVVYCASGVRSALAAETLQTLGFGDVRSLAGGFAAWTQGGHPVEPGR